MINRFLANGAVSALAVALTFTAAPSPAIATNMTAVIADFGGAAERVAPTSENQPSGRSGRGSASSRGSGGSSQDSGRGAMGSSRSGGDSMGSARSGGGGYSAPAMRGENRDNRGTARIDAPRPARSESRPSYSSPSSTPPARSSELTERPARTYGAAAGANAPAERGDFRERGRTERLASPSGEARGWRSGADQPDRSATPATATQGQRFGGRREAGRGADTANNASQSTTVVVQNGNAATTGGNGWREGRRGDNQQFRDSRRADNRDWRDGRRDNGRDWRDNRRGDNRQWRDNRRGPQVAYNQGFRDGRNWDRGWRNDRRYNWLGFRQSNRVIFAPGPYFAPFSGHFYRPVGIGFFLDPLFFQPRFFLNDPWAFRLPSAGNRFRWVRYYDDVLLVDIFTGEVVDAIENFFW